MLILNKRNFYSDSELDDVGWGIVNCDQPSLAWAQFRCYAVAREQCSVTTFCGHRTFCSALL